MARPERLFTEMKPYLDGQHTIPQIAEKVKASPAAIYAAVRRGGFQSQVKWAYRHHANGKRIEVYIPTDIQKWLVGITPKGSRVDEMVTAILTDAYLDAKDGKE